MSSALPTLGRILILRKRNMRTHEIFVQPATDTPMLHRGGLTGWGKTLTAITLLVSATGIVLAQRDRDDAFLPSPVQDVSTVPANGDVNPYGVAFVPNNFQTGSGPLHHGDILVSNFNNAANLQGTGTTIMDVPSNNMPTVFFQGTAPLGLTTALGTLQYGFVVVGNGPTTDGSSATAQPGSLLVINNTGTLVQTIANSWINYPWDMTLIDRGDRAIAFVSNALDGTVNRLDFKVSST